MNNKSLKSLFAACLLQFASSSFAATVIVYDGMLLDYNPADEYFFASFPTEAEPLTTFGFMLEPQETVPFMFGSENENLYAGVTTGPYGTGSILVLPMLDVASDSNDFFSIIRIPQGTPWLFEISGDMLDGQPMWVTLGLETPEVEAYLYTLIAESSLPQVPIPATIWLFGSGLLGLVGVAKRKKEA